MLGRLGAVLLRRRRAVLLVAVVLALAGAGTGGVLFDRLKGGGFNDPAAESSRAADALAERFGREELNLVLLVRAEDGVDDPGVAAYGADLAARLAAEDGVAQVVSYWDEAPAPGLRAEDGGAALVLAAVEGDETEAGKRLADLEPTYEGEVAAGVEIVFGGPAVINQELSELSERDAIRGELLAFPLLLIVLIAVFGSLLAAALPLAVGVVTILLTLGLLWALAGVTDLSVFAVNVVTVLGLGLAVDYSLLMVNRYREELAAGREQAEAIRLMMLSAGRTVIFSAVTVAVTLASLAWFPALALRSMAYAGIAVSLLTALVTLTVLPVLLAVLGSRANAGRMPRRRGGSAAGDAVENGFWHRLASVVMRRAVPVATLGTLLLLVLGAPFLDIKLGSADERGLPESSAGRQVAEELRADFDAGESDALSVVLPSLPPEENTDRLAAYAAELSRLADVSRVDAATGSYVDGVPVAEPGPAHAGMVSADGGATSLQVVPEAVGNSALEDLVEAARAVEAPGEAEVGGRVAVAMDSTDSILDRLPVAGLTLLAAMVVLLFLLTGSVLLPFVAMLLSALGLTAAFGVLVWGFQDGHLSGLLGFTVTGEVVSTVPVLLFACAFGLGMDYQVFLLSRIREEYEGGADPTTAVAVGLERVGRIVTAAAVALSVVFLAFLISEISFMQALGVGLPLAVLMDATLIRGALLPAAMRLGGEAMWWAPPALRRVHDRFGLHEGPAAGAPTTTRPEAPAPLSSATRPE
ncbi:putative drug exporter of the RND superfamily [Streptomyces zhaozhouensis]|uniref:Putative drug exporter of the RND superfamily n=1 Tax=Streptomyces zhaozhouensis TaxID=1300267 RepID=A0A286E4G9_9ACTN|nr:MMPL family transporter [Streptomyces zhaozhouensis]SOD65779.1 putative drug exporter of the RND superfamily [Streptomyces zhaozhouensis]